MEEFNATMFVDQAGIIRSINYSVTFTPSNGQQQTTTVTYQVTKLNATTVEKPDWIEKAKSQSQSQVS